MSCWTELDFVLGGDGEARARAELTALRLATARRLADERHALEASRVERERLAADTAAWLETVRTWAAANRRQS